MARPPACGLQAWPAGSRSGHPIACRGRPPAAPALAQPSFASRARSGPPDPAAFASARPSRARLAAPASAGHPGPASPGNDPAALARPHQDWLLSAAAPTPQGPAHAAYPSRQDALAGAHSSRPCPATAATATATPEEEAAPGGADTAHPATIARARPRWPQSEPRRPRLPSASAAEPSRARGRPTSLRLQRWAFGHIATGPCSASPSACACPTGTAKPLRARRTQEDPPPHTPAASCANRLCCVHRFQQTPRLASLCLIFPSSYSVIFLLLFILTLYKRNLYSCYYGLPQHPHPTQRGQAPMPRTAQYCLSSKSLCFGVTLSGALPHTPLTFLNSHPVNPQHSYRPPTPRPFPGLFYSVGHVLSQL